MKNFWTRSEFFTLSNGISNLNFLALVLYEILGGPKFTLGGVTPPGHSMAEKKLTYASYAQVLGYTYVIVKFQLRNSITVRHTESSFYNRFVLKSPPNGVLGGLWEGLRYFVGSPLGTQRPSIYVVW